MNKYICAVAGRSGGHIIPCIIYAEQLKKNLPNSKLLFFSTGNQLDTAIIKDFPSITYHSTLPLDGIPTKKNFFSYFSFVIQLIISTFKIFYHLITKRPSVIISTGGYVSVPVCIIGYLLRIRVELFELNIVPGKATLFLARFASIIHTCFSETKNYFKKYKTDLIEYPVRFNNQKLLSREDALKKLNFSSTKKTILILGGSQGSFFINELIKKACLLDKNYFSNIQIIHQTGQQVASLKEFYQEQNIINVTFSYTAHINEFYPAADLVLCRAGAGTLFETLFFKKPAIIIPLETITTDHQLDNALSFSKEHPELFSVLRQKELETNSSLFIQQVQYLLDSKR